MTPDAQDALSFIAQLSIPREAQAPAFESLEPSVQLDGSRDQAMLAGSELIAFTRGVSEQRRSDLVNGTLLAQLAASKLISDPDDILGWYRAYQRVLANVGFVTQESSFEEFQNSGQVLETHEAILSVASTALAGAPAALELIKATLTALKGDGPLITVFEHQSKVSKAAKFQVTLVSEDQDAGFLVRLMAFSLVAKSALTQVLFLKFSQADVTFRHASHSVTVSQQLLDTTRNAVLEKLGSASNQFLKELQI